MAADGRRGDDDEVARFGQCVADVGSRRAQKAGLNEHLVGFRPGWNLYADQGFILTATMRDSHRCCAIAARRC